MRKIIKYGKFKHSGESDKKTQIILTHTSRGINQYLTGLKYRFNCKYDKIPNYIIDKEGKILELLSPEKTSKIFNNKKIDNKSIIISLENLGWLEKEPLKKGFINWIGNIYKGEVFERKWRDYLYWDKYTKEQTDSCIYLCKKLIKDFGISEKFVGHNTKINGIENFDGIVTRSNYFTETTDINPSFEFDYFLKNIENE